MEPEQNRSDEQEWELSDLELDSVFERGRMATTAMQCYCQCFNGCLSNPASR